jgi:hypothetical protein
VRAAAELPHIGLADAAAIVLVIQRAEPERYERAAIRWLAKLATEADVGLAGIAEAAIALEALPDEPGARGQLAVLRVDATTEAGICRASGVVAVRPVLGAGGRGDPCCC